MGWHRAIRLTDGLWIEPVARTQDKAVRLVNQGQIGFIRNARPEDQRVGGVEPKRLFNLDFIIIKITDQRMTVIGGETHIGDAFGLLLL